MELTVEYHENTVSDGKNKGAIYADHPKFSIGRLI